MRSSLLNGIRKKARSGRLILAAGGSDAQSLARARDCGADFGILYHFGKHPTKCHSLVTGMMPFGNSNSILKELAAQTLPALGEFPIFGGVCATDPFRRIDRFLEELKELGFAGVQNYPTVGLIDGNMRASLELNETGYHCEAVMMKTAIRMEFVGCAFAFSEKEAAQMAQAGAELIVMHMGLVTQRMKAQGKAHSIESCSALIRKAAAACRKIRPETLLLCHGYPLEEPEAIAKLLSMTPELDGYLDLSCYTGLSGEQIQKRMKLLCELVK